MGSLDRPIRPLSLAIGAEASFVARTIDVDVKHLPTTLERAAAHKGTAFVEIYQNCNIFNDGAFEYATDKSIKSDNMLYLEHGKPLIFGKDRDKGIRLNGLDPEVVRLGGGVTDEDLLIHDENGRVADAGVLAEPDGLSGDAGVLGGVARREPAHLRRAAAAAERQGGSGQGRRPVGGPVQQRRHVDGRGGEIT